MSMLNKTLCPAKINLFLHILGKRADGYHILESLVTFAEYGDVLGFVRNEDGLKLKITGAYAAELSDFDIADNLIIKAAESFEKRFDLKISGCFELIKKLPVSSGIGGGSANAASTLKLLIYAYDKNADIDPLLLPLGADVPVCFNDRNVIMSGIGEGLYEWPRLPQLHAVLVNPNVAVSTAKIFAKLNASTEIAAYDFVGKPVPKFDDAYALVVFLKNQRNDMQSAAIDICPQIGDVLTALNASNDIMFAQMSGSGATCFGIFATAEQAEIAALKLSKKHSDWWIQPTIFSG